MNSDVSMTQIQGHSWEYWCRNRVPSLPKQFWMGPSTPGRRVGRTERWLSQGLTAVWAELQEQAGPLQVCYPKVSEAGLWLVEWGH